MPHIRWTEWNGGGLELCAVLETTDGLRFEGAMVGKRSAAFYCVVTDRLFRTREVEVRFAGGPRLHMLSDGEGRWRDQPRDQPINALEGCLDVDIGVTPSTNVLPIRRLRLLEGESREITVAYVPVPTEVGGAFSPSRVAQRYTCLKAGRRYRYEGLFSGFMAELEVDDHGFVLDYPETFRRVRDHQSE